MFRINFYAKCVCDKSRSGRKLWDRVLMYQSRKIAYRRIIKIEFVSKSMLLHNASSWAKVGLQVAAFLRSFPYIWKRVGDSQLS
jgi:hypothetical protein